MDTTDWLNINSMIVDDFEQLYVTTHPAAQIPTTAQGSIRLPGASVNFNTNILIIAAVVLAAVLLLRR